VTQNTAASPANIEVLGATCVENPRVSGSIPLQATIFIGFAAENVLQNSVARLSHDFIAAVYPNALVI